MAVFTVFSKTMRQPGMQVSAQVTVPANVPKGKTIVCIGQLDAADAADATLHIDFGAEYLDADNVTWVPLATNAWDGGVVDRHTGLTVLPWFQVSSDGSNASLMAGRPVRAFCNPSRAVSFGATATI